MKQVGCYFSVLKIANLFKPDDCKVIVKSYATAYTAALVGCERHFFFRQTADTRIVPYFTEKANLYKIRAILI